jgi:hypothetical protein
LEIVLRNADSQVAGRLRIRPKDWLPALGDPEGKQRLIGVLAAKSSISGLEKPKKLVHKGFMVYDNAGQKIWFFVF